MLTEKSVDAYLEFNRPHRVRIVRRRREELYVPTRGVDDGEAMSLALVYSRGFSMGV